MALFKLFENKLAGTLTIFTIESLGIVSIQSVKAMLPEPRWGHSAVLLNNKLYIHGGKAGSKNDLEYTNQLLILDVSKSFAISDPAWATHSVGPKVAYHTISIGGSQNELLVLYGGEYLNTPNEPVPENPLFYYNTLEESPEWYKANLSLGTPRKEHTAVTRLNDSMNYFFGGIPDVSDITVSALVQFQDLFKLDTRINFWNIQSVDPNTPSGRFHHTATILPDGNMYVIGGYSKDKLVDISQIYVYDTIKEIWSVQTAVGTLPSARRDHAAVGTHDGKVIIHGGVNQDYLGLFDDIAVLDTTTQPNYTWNVVKAKGTIPPGRYSHTATMIGTNMLVAFGFLANDTPDNNIYVLENGFDVVSLDTITYTWKESYSPENLDFTQTKYPLNDDPIQKVKASKTGIIVGSTIGTILFLLLVGGLFWFHRKKRQGSFYAAPYPSIKEQTSNQEKPNKFNIFWCAKKPTLNQKTKTFGVPSGSTAEELPRPSMGSGLAVPIESSSHDKDYSAALEENMMGIDIQQTNFMIVPKSPLRVTNPDNLRDD
ncbi:3519_t:CDS:2 [Funneliformis caledonium]|uniref:3519_t:CDS:1 n=1 Tax=Funneliformis caledonium TaxID=1117310 RepID=A0A9N9B857_9GLOM|nr:3519_t:CDS:2 [Funneliformis caledonium]